MLSKETFIEKMDELLIVFPGWGFDRSDKDIVGVWYERFCDLKDQQFINMVDSYIECEKFNPTVAGLMQYKPHDYQYKDYTLEDQIKEVKEYISLGREYFQRLRKENEYDALLKERERLEQLRDSKRESTVV